MKEIKLVNNIKAGKKPTANFRGAFNAIVIDVLEGDGRKEPFRIIHYVYIDNEFIGKIDNYEQNN